MNLSYKNLISMKNLIEISFLKEDIDQILNNNDINKRFQKIISTYNMMNDKVENIINFKTQIKNNSTNINEIALRIKTNKNNLNKYFYILDNTTEKDKYRYNEKGKNVKHNHDNLKEMN